MKVTEIIQNEISLAHPEIHKTRLNTLFTFVRSGLKDQRLAVTYLGRGLKSLSKTDKKHDIKRADRLCGNTHLHSERIDFYKYMVESLIVNERHPLPIKMLILARPYCQLVLSIVRLKRAAVDGIENQPLHGYG